MATIVATAVLHNILLQQKDDLPQELDTFVDNELFQEIPTLPIRQLGNAVRTNLIEILFS